MKNTILIIAISLFSLKSSGQYTENFRTLGDKAFHDKNYYEAAYYYRKSADGLNLIKHTDVPFQADIREVPKKQVEDRNYIRYQLAESYRLYENYLEAEGWYDQVINDNAEARFPQARLWYGVCLRANQHFNEAIKQLQQFELAGKIDDKYKQLAEKEIKNCHFALDQYQNPLLLEVTRLKDHWNSDGSNYAIVKRDNNYWFTSSRLVKNDKKHLNRIYHYGDKDEKPQIINISNDHKDAEYGTPSLYPAGKYLYFTSWYKSGSKSIHAVYKSTWVNDAWTKPEKLNTNVNADGFDAIQPFVTEDGKQLFFVSNKPGGQGGYDIWMSVLDDNGTPVNSQNLGPVINTPMDEQAPYYDVTLKRLVYSSKGFTGLGGFDFFESRLKSGSWTAPENMGFPMNSAKDDLYYSPDRNNPKKFYISSDRQSDCCLELFEVTDRTFFLSGNVISCDGQQPLAGAKISLIDTLTGQSVLSETTREDGSYFFKFRTMRTRKLKIEKDKYFSKVIYIKLPDQHQSDTLSNPSICVQPFEVGKPIVIKNILYDYNKATLRPESEQVLNAIVTILKDNPKLKIELSAHTDSIGSDAYNQKLSQERAESCVKYITSQGITDDRIFAKGYGKSKPVAPNSLPDGKDNPEGRQLNRRTEFTVLKTETDNK